MLILCQVQKTDPVLVIFRVKNYVWTGKTNMEKNLL